MAKNNNHQTVSGSNSQPDPYTYDQLIAYIRSKVDQLLDVMGTLPLRADELDAKNLLEFDPIGIVAESFRHVQRHLRETNQELAQARNELNAILDAAGAAIVVLNREFGIVAANDLARQLFLDCEKADGLVLCDCLERGCDEIRARLLKANVNGDLHSEHMDVTVEGRHYHLVATPLVNRTRGEHHFTLIFTDITERKRAEEKLREAAAVFDSTAEAIVVADRDANITVVNRAFTEITGYSAAEVIGRNPRLLQSGRHGKAFFRALWTSLQETGHWQGEIWDRRKNGEIFPVWQTISAIRDDDGSVVKFVSILSDITKVKQSQEQLNFLAHHDSLTGLPNRVVFSDRLTHALELSQREGTKLALVFIDLDRFKNINDSLGHPVGDKLLVQAATRLKQSVRSVDTVARLGGDEFVVLLEHIGQAQDAAKLCQELIEAFQEPFDIGGHELHLTLSMGISLYPRDGGDAATLLKNADAAMYRAKDEGRNAFQFFTKELSVSAFERLTLETALRRALERDQLEVYYQPQYCLRKGRMSAAEALLRWNHPEFGIVSPDSFIPVAEDSGLIIPIGEWVLMQACTTARRWRDAGYPIDRIAVNVSGVQIQRSDIVGVVRKVLAKTQLPGDALELEITESVIMQRPEEASRVLHELRSLGIKIAIDDFGTGYSSLSQLKKLPVDRLKIDRSFVRDVVETSDDEAIVRAVIALGKAMNLEVVAEGVEELEQQQFLTEAGCHSAQGYLYSRPLPVPMFEAELLAKAHL